MRSTLLLALAVSLLSSASALANPHELRLPLHDGALRLAEVTPAMRHDLPMLDRLKSPQIDLRGLSGSLFVHALTEASGDGCRITLTNDALIVHVDVDHLPHDSDQARCAVRTFVAVDHPAATAAQARHYGLFLPETFDPSRNLAVLIHGLDCDASMLRPMGTMLVDRGIQVAYFCYPSDQPIADSAVFLSQRLADFHRSYPAARVDLIGHSMGGLVARAYVEGNQYLSDVDHLIMVGTPNNGSGWAGFHLLLKAQKQLDQARSDPQWTWSWAVTDGLGEGARDCALHSKFLTRLNAQPRRAGVRYTVIAGSHSAVSTFESEWEQRIEHWAPNRARGWWGVRQIESGLEHSSQKLADTIDDSDGPVAIKHTRLKGVDDNVILPADHCALFIGNEAKPPAALAAIMARLANGNQNRD